MNAVAANVAAHPAITPLELYASHFATLGRWGVPVVVVLRLRHGSLLVDGTGVHRMTVEHIFRLSCC
jgi:hypothetical protein